MLPGPAEIERALTGTVKLMRRDPAGRFLFDTSLDGFWRSFLVIVIALPLLLPAVLADRAYVLAHPEPGAVVVSATVFYLIEAASVLLGWIAFPLVMLPIARWYGLGNRYVSYIAVHNWATLLPLIPFSAAAVLYLVGLISLAGLSMAAFLVLGVELYLRFQVARLVAGVDPAIAAAFTILDFLLGLAVDLVAFRLIGL